jgi:hypothetical protein
LPGTTVYSLEIARSFRSKKSCRLKSLRDLRTDKSGTNRKSNPSANEVNKEANRPARGREGRPLNGHLDFLPAVDRKGTIKRISWPSTFRLISDLKKPAGSDGRMTIEPGENHPSFSPKSSFSIQTKSGCLDCSRSRGFCREISFRLL